MQSELSKQRNQEKRGATVNSSSQNVGPADWTVQSQLDRQATFDNAASKVDSKLVNDPGNVTKEESDLLYSRKQRAFGTTEKGGLASQAQHQVAENEGEITRQSNASTLDANSQSQKDRQANYEEIAAKVSNKLANDPANITKGEADTLYSREQRVFDHTEKGGLAAQTQY